MQCWREGGWLTTAGFMDRGRLARCYPITISPPAAATDQTHRQIHREKHRAGVQHWVVDTTYITVSNWGQT